MTTYTARYIFPATSPPLERGTITLDGGLIESVDPHGVRAPDTDLGNVAMIPGLVNAHTHLDLTGARGLIPPTDPEHFTDWLMGVIEYRKARTREQVQEDLGDGVMQSTVSGTTTIGDIDGTGFSWIPVAASQIRAVVFHEMIGLSNDRARHAQQLAETWDRVTIESMKCRKGFSPHAPYSASKSLIYLAARLAQKHSPKSPTAIHLAESQFEEDLIYHRRGPFKVLLESLGAWNGKNLADDYKSVMVDVRQPKLFVHCNYLPRTQRIPRNSTIVYCPRTHAAFKHPRHPFAEFLARGVNVALGTDSLASNPDLDLFAEARFVYHNRKDVSGETILKMATINGAKALGFDTECGSLEAGKSADIVVMPVGDGEADDPHDLLFNAPPGNRRSIFRGCWRD